jgi:hypothetical protein
MDPQTPNPLVALAQNIPGIPPAFHSQIIENVSYIDLANPGGNTQYTEYVTSLINIAINGDDGGGQGLEYLIEVIGNELGALSYIEVNLEQLDGGVQILTTEAVPIPELPIIQNEAVGRGITAAHNLMDEWNQAVKSGNLDRSSFANLGTVRDQLNDLAHDLATTRDARAATRSRKVAATAERSRL